MVSNFERKLHLNELLLKLGRSSFEFEVRFRHICHASLTIGDIPVSAGAAVITPQRRFTSCAAGFRLKSVGGCEQVSLSPHGVLALEVPPPGLRLALIAGNSLVYHLLGCPSWRRA